MALPGHRVGGGGMKEQDNSQQREYWNGSAGATWVEAQAQLDSMLAPLSEIALARLAVQPAERVIDIGCGCGATSIAMQRQGAAVWGIDLSQQMLAQAKARAQGLKNIAFSQTDAAVQAYTPDHDALFSRFGVMFFADPVGAFTNLRTALKADGRMVFLCWQKPRDNPWMAVAGAAVQPFLPPPEPVNARDPGPFAFAETAWVEEVLTRAGFSDVSFDDVRPTLRLGADLDEVMAFQGRVGPLARVLAELSEADRVQALAAAREALAAYVTPTGVHLGCAAWLVSAKISA